MLKVYLSQSNLADKDDVLKVRRGLAGLPVQIIQYGTHNPMTNKMFQPSEADIMIMVPPHCSAEDESEVSIGAGQYAQLSEFNRPYTDAYVYSGVSNKGNIMVSLVDTYERQDYLPDYKDDYGIIYVEERLSLKEVLLSHPKYNSTTQMKNEQGEDYVEMSYKTLQHFTVAEPKPLQTSVKPMLAAYLFI